MPERPLRVAIVGSGPAGMYAAGHLLGTPHGTYLEGRMVHLGSGRPVEVDVLERLATPWGLVRGGVAPDHPEKKLVAHLFESVASRPEFRWFGNVEVGRDVAAEELGRWYDAVIFAVGAPADQHLGVPGEDLPGCWAAGQFVGWYNGHPDSSDLSFDLQTDRAVVVGNGNVALDAARMLTRSPAELRRTDIAEHALHALERSAIREVVILGRRGHREAAFHNPELEELAELADVDLVVEAEHEGSGGRPSPWDDDQQTARKLATLRRHAGSGRSPNSRRIVLRFLVSPLEVTGEGRVQAVTVVRNALVPDDTGRLRARATNDTSTILTGLVLRAVGYRGAPIAGVPFDEARGVIPSTDGRVEGRSGMYVTGWIKRGPSGIIGTNKKCSRDTVCSLLADASADTLPMAGTLSRSEVTKELRSRHPDLVSWDDWTCIDRHERRAGRVAGRPRQKLTDRSAIAEIQHRG